jgi:HlyD family secretion protein
MNLSFKKLISIGFILSIVLSFIIYKSFFNDVSEIILNGNVEIQDVNVSFRVSGRVHNITSDEGQIVKNGDIIAVLEDDIYKAQFDLAKSKFAESDFNFKNAEKDYIRNKGLYQRKSISEKLYDDSLVKYNISKSQRDASSSNLELAKINLDDTVLKSPVDGIVLNRNIEVGEIVNAGSIAFSIMPNSKTKIKTFANEEVLSKIKYNDKVYVIIDSISNKKFLGHISFISSEAEFTPKNIETKELRTSLMYRIRITLDTESPELKGGMPVTCRLSNNNDKD